MDAYVAIPLSDPYLKHHGIKNMRWGYRRWQNPDGSLTPEGRIHYGKGLPKVAKNIRSNLVKKSYSGTGEKLNKVKNLEKAGRQRKQALNEMSDKYSRASKRRELAEMNLEEAQRKDKDSLFGNKRGVKSAQKELEATKANERFVQNDFNKIYKEYESLKLTALEEKEIYNNERNAANKRAEKYIKRYGSTSMKELMDSDSKFKQDVMYVESNQDYQHYRW